MMLAILLGGCQLVTDAEGFTQRILPDGPPYPPVANVAHAEQFKLLSAKLAPGATPVTCAAGQTSVALRPHITIQHSYIANVPIYVRLYEARPRGVIRELETVQVISKRNGETVLNKARFERPCPHSKTDEAKYSLRIWAQDTWITLPLS